MKVIFTKGMQASGKSTWAKQFVAENQSYKRVNRDEIRKMLSNYTFNDENEKLVTKIEMEMISNIIGSDYNLVIDNMNLNNRYIKTYENFIFKLTEGTNKSPYEFEVKEFPITLPEAIERDRFRPDSLGEAILKRTWRTHELELKAMIERAKPKYEEDESLPHCVICDIDGTLSNSSHRRIFDEKEAVNDKVMLPVRKLLTLVEKSKSVKKIFIFSGRKDSAREETLEWLNKNYIPYSELHMRKSTDNRSDIEVKSDMFEEIIRGKYYCEFVIDDRPCVLEMWTKKGLFTFNVNQTPYVTKDGKGDF